MGLWESTPLLNEDSKDVMTAAASELAKQMTKEAIKNVGTIAGEVGGVVAGAIGKAVVTGLWGLIFPSESSDITIEGIKEVVKQELEQETIVGIKGMLHDLIDFLSKDYKTDKQNSDLTKMNDRKRLHDKLERANDHFVGTIGVLMQDKYAKIGMSSFLLLAGLRIALYQEMANVDPENPSLNPAESSRYARPQTGLVAQYAKEYADHVDIWWSKIIEDRRNAVEFHNVGITGNPHVHFPPREWFDDNAIGKNRVDVAVYDVRPELGTTRLYKRYEEYKNEVAEKLAAKFHYPDKIAADWRKLIDQPINMAINNN